MNHGKQRKKAFLRGPMDLGKITGLFHEVFHKGRFGRGIYLTL
jgi:hypothetical protein